MTKPQDKLRGWAAARKAILAGLRFTSLRLRLVVVFGLVALTAAVSASGINSSVPTILTARLTFLSVRNSS